MIGKCFSVLLILFVLFAATASPALIAAPPAELPTVASIESAPFIGLYVGTVRNGTGVDPCSTVFKFDDDGKLIGTFDYADSNTAASTTGVLIPLSYDNDERSMVCQWRDRHGTGLLILTFNSEFSGFTGQWNERHQPPQHSWNGKRRATVKLIPVEV